ncbi:SDR family NAD(P)-dependent oxidoreductase [Pseudonocardia sp. CA-107938]|uniref:SDR family NAD(P)-dependent oxidoreductase n=1 Tax=Pseudonocardia sp. CA-107938 TaxID=3240021 RepID=UPI003D901064
MADERMAGQTAVVTGAAGGIGAGVAAALVARGARVVLVDVDAERLAATVAGLRPGDAEAAVVDVTDPDAVDALAARLFDAGRPVRVLVNNAGVEATGPVWDTPVERWRRLFAVNVDGVFHGIRSFVPRMGAQPERSYVVNVSSIGGISTGPFMAPYVASKHAVQALTECLHAEAAKAFPQVQVSVVNPGPVATGLFGDTSDGDPVRRAMQRLAAQGADPVVVGRQIVDGMLAGDFWIETHPDRFAAAAQRRAAMLLDRTPPG